MAKKPLKATETTTSTETATTTENVNMSASMPARTVQELPASILQAIADGHLTHSIESVTISAAKSPTNKDETREFDALYAQDVEGISILSGGKFEPQTPKGEGSKDERTDEQKRLGACDHYNYGRLLGVRQQVRSALEGDIVGPEKAIEKSVKGMSAMLGTPGFETEAAIKAFVISQFKASGKVPADYGEVATA